MPERRSAKRRTKIDTVLAYALAKPGAWLDHPWGEDHDVVKVGARMFVVMGAQDEPSFSVKHEDMEARDVWRGRYPDALRATPYMANKPWSNVLVQRMHDDEDLFELVDESYDAVVRRLPRKHRPEGWDAGLV